MVLLLSFFFFKKILLLFTLNFFFYIFMFIRSTLPRYRIDFLIEVCWSFYICGLSITTLLLFLFLTS